MKTLILITIIVFLSTGCTAATYEAERRNGADYTYMKIKSRREFTGGVEIDYDKEAGAFLLRAGDVTTGSSPLEEMAAGLIPALISAISPITTEQP